jgi:hypothetical protein
LHAEGCRFKSGYLHKTEISVKAEPVPGFRHNALADRQVRLSPQAKATLQKGMGKSIFPMFFVVGERILRERMLAR